MDRETFQEMLSISNPYWKQFVDDMDERGEKPRTNPDGDVRSLTQFSLLCVLNRCLGRSRRRLLRRIQGSFLS